MIWNCQSSIETSNQLTTTTKRQNIQLYLPGCHLHLLSPRKYSTQQIKQDFSHIAINKALIIVPVQSD